MRRPNLRTHWLQNHWMSIIAAALLMTSACEESAPPTDIVLFVRSTQDVDEVRVSALNPDLIEAFSGSAGDQVAIIDVRDVDLSAEAATVQLLPGDLGTRVQIRGKGFRDGTVTPLVTGRVEVTFADESRVEASLNLRPPSAGDPDLDDDGYPASEDCNDGDPRVNPFLNEICADERDNDCDGAVDQGCPCTDGQTRSCFDGPLQLAGIGECVTGTQTCAAGEWQACEGSVGPEEETCDNKDNDCDGCLDEGCSCVAGAVRYYHNGVVAGTVGELGLKGECRAGTQTCQGGVWDDCSIKAIFASDESCDGRDEDCDGVFDNGFDLDGDDFTVCGTRSDGGTALARTDCNDSDATINPGALDRCDDDIDSDCDSLPFSCPNPLSCESAGYYWGIQGDQCYYATGQYGGCDGVSGRCTTASDVCGAQSIGDPFGAPRQVCELLSGCDETTPVVRTEIDDLSDPAGDCPAVVCDGSGGGVAYYDGWTRESRPFDGGTINTDVCWFRADFNGGCKGIDLCEDNVDCGDPAHDVQGGEARALTACEVDNGGCTSSTPPSVSAVSNAAEPDGRCGSVNCADFYAGWDGLTCERYDGTGDPQDIWCDNNSDCDRPLTCANSGAPEPLMVESTAVTCAAAECRIDGGCPADTLIDNPSLSDFCLSGGAKGGCPGALVCDADGGKPTDALCTCLPWGSEICGGQCCSVNSDTAEFCDGGSACDFCVYDDHCGSDCLDCGGETCALVSAKGMETNTAHLDCCVDSNLCGGGSGNTPFCCDRPAVCGVYDGGNAPLDACCEGPRYDEGLCHGECCLDGGVGDTVCLDGGFQGCCPTLRACDGGCCDEGSVCNPAGDTCLGLSPEPDPLPDK